jgi:ribose 5-phosphate isomerase B
MRIAIGADHGGFDLKVKIIKYLKLKGHTVKDFGTYSPEPCDYPQYGFAVARAVGDREYPRGILVCKSGIGMSIAANKVRGIRAALVDNVETAISSREHNDSNIIVFGSKAVNIYKAKKMLDAWLKAGRPGGRHLRRVNQIKALEGK